MNVLWVKMSCENVLLSQSKYGWKLSINEVPSQLPNQVSKLSSTKSSIKKPIEEKIKW